MNFQMYKEKSSPLPQQRSFAPSTSRAEKSKASDASGYRQKRDMLSLNPDQRRTSMMASKDKNNTSKRLELNSLIGVVKVAPRGPGFGLENKSNT